MGTTVILLSARELHNVLYIFLVGVDAFMITGCPYVVRLLTVHQEISEATEDVPSSSFHCHECNND